jgi:hypothetical protein
MFIIVEHTISDPARVQEITRAAVLPPGLTLHQVLPNAEGTRQVCLWEAADVDEVKAFVEPALAGVSTNVYFAVEAGRAMGLPVAAG